MCCSSWWLLCVDCVPFNFVRIHLVKFDKLQMFGIPCFPVMLVVANKIMQPSSYCTSKPSFPGTIRLPPLVVRFKHYYGCVVRLSGFSKLPAVKPNKHRFGMNTRRTYLDKYTHSTTPATFRHHSTSLRQR